MWPCQKAKGREQMMSWAPLPAFGSIINSMKGAVAICRAGFRQECACWSWYRSCVGKPKVCFTTGGDPISSSEMIDAQRSPFQVRFWKTGPYLPSKPFSLSRNSEKRNLIGWFWSVQVKPGIFQILDIGIWAWDAHDSKGKNIAIVNFIEGQYQKVRMESRRIILFMSTLFQFYSMWVFSFFLQKRWNLIASSFQRFCILEIRVWSVPELGQRSRNSAKFQGSLFLLLITGTCMNTVPGPKPEEGMNATFLGFLLDPPIRDNSAEICGTIWGNEQD